MSYLKSVLQPDEQVRYVTNIHWIVYVPGLLVILLAAICAVMKIVAPAAAVLWDMAVIAFAILGVLMLFVVWFRRWTTEIAVTNKRIILKRGFIRRHTEEMNMDKVASVDVEQSILGRLLGYGDIYVRAAGQSFEALKAIANPIDFRNHVTAQ